jgi:hypothetical protein
MKNHPVPNQRNNKRADEEIRIARLERRVLKFDARHEWIKNNNMREVCIELTDVRWIYQDQFATFNTFSTPVTLDAN